MALDRNRLCEGECILKSVLKKDTSLLMHRVFQKLPMRMPNMWDKIGNKRALAEK